MFSAKRRQLYSLVLGQGLQCWCLASILPSSSWLLDAAVDVFVDSRAMGDPQNVDSSVAVEENVAVQTRALLGVPAPGDVKMWMDNFFLNQAYGAFCMNILADIFVRVFVMICTSLALRRCWGARKRETRSNDLQLLLILQNQIEEERWFTRSGTFIRRLVAEAVSSATPSSPAPSDVPSSSQEQADSLGQVGDVAGHPVVTEDRAPNSSNDIPEEVGGAQQKRPLRKRPNRPNGLTYDCHVADGSRSLELAGRSISAGSSTSRSQVAVPTQVPQVETGNDVVIDIPAICVFPTSASTEVGDRLMHFVKLKLNVSCDHDISSSRILQARVRATEENLSALRDVAIEGMKLNKGFTLQIGGSFLYYCTGNRKEPLLLSLKDVDVPTVLQADYSAGVLTIRGRHLEGAEIRAATVDGYMILKSIKQDPINDTIAPPERGIEVWRCTDLLPPVSLDMIQICASKRVIVEGHDVTVRSEVTSIQNTTLRTVIRNWIPSAILIVFLICQAWVLLEMLLNLIKNPLHRSWLLSLILPMAIYIIQLQSPRLENNFQDFVEQLKLAILSFRVLPDSLSSPAFFMRNGYCFQRGAKHLVKCKLIPGGPHQVAGSSDQVVGRSDQVVGRSDQVAGSSDQVDKNTSMFSEPLPTSRDWKWPCFIEKYSKSKGKTTLRKFDPDSKEEPDGASHPFTVIYFEKTLNKRNINDLPRQFVPQNITIKLYSKYLQGIIQDLLPTKLKLFEKHGEIQASDLFVLYITKALFGKAVHPDMESNDPLTSNDESDMFHLVRFLRKEYEETIIQYERMMEADVISWDMLWTLLVPRTDIIYYCDLSTDELCGKVLSTKYKFYDIKMGEKDDLFIVELEAFDYNCINFEAKRCNRTILSFKDEVKISDIDVYPLQNKANSQKGEEFFVLRGRKFYDLVLRHERRFMQYQGLVYMPITRPSKRFTPSNPYPSSHRESGDGRIMIDKGGFVKMQPNLSMEIVHPETKWVQGRGLKMKAGTNDLDRILKYAPATVYGYSFSARLWGCFRIEGISGIQFIATAFDTLVMREDMKNTLFTLAEHYIKHSQCHKDLVTNVDPFPNKGKGCIILLYGPPGTGKTLTVESLAEKLECPLWQLSVPTNYHDPIQLETDLIKTFDIAASWRAILVLDEADIYLSSRRYSPLSSNVSATNAMTGVFLRVLEYYTGILFLTTNLIDSIEPAIYSRMSLFVKYEEFNIESRKQLWINFLNRIDFQHPSQEFWDNVLPQEFNGRVIRNIIQNAQILAQRDGAESISEKHLLKAFQVMATPSTASRLIQHEDKLDQKQTSTTLSTYD